MIQNQTSNPMKTTFTLRRAFKRNEVLILIVLFLLLLSSQVDAQVMSSVTVTRRPDANFPAKGHFNAGLITTYTGITPPPVVIADMTYGVSGRFAVGAMGGTTGAIGLYGLKLNSILMEKNSFRVMYRMVMVYYPGRSGAFLFDRQQRHIMAWMLSMGTIDAEWRTGKGIRWALGMGMMETNCVAGLKAWLGDTGEEKNLPFELFHTVQGSVSIPLSGKIVIRPEVFCVMKRFELIQQGKFKVFPINPYLKFVYSF